MSANLTPLQRKTLRQIASVTKAIGRAPTERELVTRLRLRLGTTKTVFLNSMRSLQRRGLVLLTPIQARTVSLSTEARASSGGAP